ncbi:unnamed protein product, partial [Prunus brigantina]
PTPSQNPEPSPTNPSPSSPACNPISSDHHPQNRTPFFWYLSTATPPPFQPNPPVSLSPSLPFSPFHTQNLSHQPTQI